MPYRIPYHGIHYFRRISGQKYLCECAYTNFLYTNSIQPPDFKESRALFLDASKQINLNIKELESGIYGFDFGNCEMIPNQQLAPFLKALIGQEVQGKDGFPNPIRSR